MLIPAKVRKADASDEDELMAMCKELHRENGLFDMDEDKVRSFLQRAFHPRGGAMLGVIGERGKLEGSIYMLISNFWYSSAYHLEELWSFVLPPYRKSDNAKHLISFAKRCSDELRIPLVIGVLSNERTAAKVRLYERQLQKPVGAFFVHQPTTTIVPAVARMNHTAVMGGMVA